MMQVQQEIIARNYTRPDYADHQSIEKLFVVGTFFLKDLSMIDYVIQRFVVH